MKCFAQISIAALALGAVWLGASSHASAQATGDQKVIESFEQNQTDVREALRSLFRDVKVSYSMAPDVQGVVTLSLKQVTFEVALQNILRQVDATYRVKGGVYEIIKHQDADRPIQMVNGDTATNSMAVTAEPTAMAVDGKYLYVLKDTEIFKFEKDSLKLVKTGSLREIPIIVQKK